MDIRIGKETFAGKYSTYIFFYVSGPQLIRDGLMESGKVCSGHFRSVKKFLPVLFSGQKTQNHTVHLDFLICHVEVKLSLLS